MSDFGEALFDLLPLHSTLHDTNNPGRKVIDNTVGEWFDHHSILDFYNNLFIDSATGGYLDLFGRDYGVPRKLDESDESYRQRIIQEKMDHLTPYYLETIYGLTLYVYVSSFDASDNDLTSDNVYINEVGYMAEASDEIKGILNKKFILDGGITWL